MVEVVLPICGTVVVTILSAALSYYFATKTNAEQDWRQKKVEHYRELLSAISDLAMDGKNKEKANERFALAAATVALVASQSVVTALMQFHNEVKFSNQNRSQERHDVCLKNLVLAMRQDLKIRPADHPQTFEFHLIGARPKAPELTAGPVVAPNRAL